MRSLVSFLGRRPTATGRDHAEGTDPKTDDDADLDTACRAPFTSLHVDQFGDARPCCQSSRILGNVGEQSLRAIWTGEPLAELRTAVAAGDLSLGCEHCAWAGRHGREATYAVRFDGDRVPDPDEGPTRLELAPSNSCNLQCTMCNGDWSSSIRLHREGRPALPRVFGDAQLAQVQDLAAGLDQLHLFGGEPFLMPEALRLLEIAMKAGARCTVTTNGSVLTPRVERLLDRPGIDLAVSVDGLGPEMYESIRVGATWDDLVEHLDRFQELAARHGNRVDVAHCLMTSNWWQFPDFLNWAAGRQLGVYVNDVLSPEELSLHHLSPPELTSVLGELERSQGRIASLDSLWHDAWNAAMDGLRQTLDDASAGRRHEHLHQPSVAEAAPAANLTGSPLAVSLAGNRREARVELTLDEHLRVVEIEPSGDITGFGLDDPERFRDRSSAEVQTLLPNRPIEARATVIWDRQQCVEERRFASRSAEGPRPEAGDVVERRTIAAGDETGATRLWFDYWSPSSVDDIAQAVATNAHDGAVVVQHIDPAAVLLAVDPSQLGTELGLRTTIGAPYLSPTDALLPERADPAPVFLAEEIEPGLVVVDLRWPDGHRLIGLALSGSDGTVVRLARPRDGYDD